MKTLLVALLLVLAVPAHAAVSLFALVNPSSELRNPVMGGASIEGKGLRLSAAVGAEGSATSALDLVARQGDLQFGVGVVADRLLAQDYSDVTIVLDSTTTTRRHDQGKHKGDKHNHGNRTFTTVHSYQSVLSFDGVDLGLSPSLFLSVSGKRTGLFVDARSLFNGGEVSNRMSVGLRW
jgi:hypothetical protein